MNTAIRDRHDADCSFVGRRTVTGHVASTEHGDDVCERTHRGARAFSLVELLVVMGVMIALVATTLPAFKALQESNRAANGRNGVNAALNTARAIAMREGRDTAVMFMFDVTRQVTSMQLLYSAGVTHDAGEGLLVATIFVPIEGQSLIELPKGAGVFACGYGATRLGDIESQNWYPDLGLLYESDSAYKYQDPWLFPRTDPLFLADDESGINDTVIQYLDTFMVRFSPDGTVVTNAEQLKYNSSDKDADGYVELDRPGGQAIGKGKFGKWNLTYDDYMEKNHSAECQLRPAPFLAVVDLYKLAAGTGIAAPWRVVAYHPTREDADQDTILDAFEVGDWINQNANIISFNRYTGSVMRDIRR
ncbi:MAG: hypothetical protein D8M59_07250 [Planctomycetes bacterium]|nr:hypothetical protein [Planctomycetota bacterium]